MRSIDLSCDLGDNSPALPAEVAEGLLSIVTSVNIACGVHAGDPVAVAANVRLAARKGVAIGAHPGLPDREAAGRRSVAVTPQDTFALVLYQIGAVAALLRAEGTGLRHVKPHGALYNMAATDRALADAVVAAVKAFDPALTLIGLSGSELLRAAQAAGLPCASEAFADRSYQADGSLTPRQEAGAMIEDQELAADQVLRIVAEGRVRASSGFDVRIQADTICLHSDGLHALAFARRIRSALQAASIDVKALA